MFWFGGLLVVRVVVLDDGGVGCLLYGVVGCGGYLGRGSS